MGRAKLARVGAPLLVAIGVCLMSTGSHALAVTRWDPRGDANVDVWRTSKEKVAIDRAPNRLRFEVVGVISEDWSVSAWIDARGGAGADYRLLQAELFGITRCSGRRLPDGEPRSVRCSLTWVDDDLRTVILTWSVPRTMLRPDPGVIRWHVHTHDAAMDPRGRHDDRAPDRGWYP